MKRAVRFVYKPRVPRGPVPASDVRASVSHCRHDVQPADETVLEIFRDLSLAKQFKRRMFNEQFERHAFKRLAEYLSADHDLLS